MIEQKEIWNELYSKEENKWKRETKSFSGVLKGKVVLELGVGNGKTLKAIIKDKPKSVYAVDFSEIAIKICKNIFSDEKVKLSVANVSKLPFDDGYFDVVVCYYVFNNLNIDKKKKAVKEIYRVLSKKGKVLFEDFAKGDFRDDGKAEKSGLIKNYFSVSEIKELFCDFKNIKLELKKFNAIKGKNLKRKIICGEIGK